MTTASAASSINTGLPPRDVLYISDSEGTFSNEDSLPSLPVPPLEQTIDKYLDSVKALVTEEEYRKTEEICHQFQSGIGKELHWKLLEKAKREKNWLEKWWEDVAYLQQRTPLLPLCSMGGFSDLQAIWPYTPERQLQYSSTYLYFQLNFWKLLRKERLRPHVSHDKPWAMHQFRRLFNTARVAGEITDKIVSYFCTESEDVSCPSHIIVLYHGHIFTFDVTDERGEILTPPELALQFRRIQEWTAVNGDGPGVAALTVDDRTEWAKNLEWLLKIHPENAQHIETINTSLLVLSFDDSEPTTITEIFRTMLAGDCRNRWADKSAMDVIFKNGAVGMISDHSPFDGLVAVVLGHYTYLSVLECGGEWKGPTTIERDLLPPRRVNFRIDGHIKNAIKEAQENFKVLADNVDATCDIFRHYGKSFLKPHKIHPEAYVQLALQYAYFTMHGRLAPTYVTASTRQFYHGRTETLRSCSSELSEWVYAMVEDIKSAKEKLNLMYIASEKFKNSMKDCMKNHGCDRHLLGLYMISVEEQLPVPEIFMDPSWIKSGGSGNFVLSTSCCGYTPVCGGVMAMREDGYGTFYSIEDNRMTFTITAFRSCPETSTARFFQSIEKALLNMEHLLTTAKL